LPFKHHLNPGDWLSPCLLDPAHRSLMRAPIEIANAIFDDIHFKAVMNSLDSGKRNTDLGPESSENNLLAACLFHSGNEILIVPFVSTVLRMRGTSKIFAAFANPTTLLINDCLSMPFIPKSICG
jgi:hypothetical protein